MSQVVNSTYGATPRATFGHKPERVPPVTSDPTAALLDAIRAHAPGAFTEGVLDLDKLRPLLGPVAEGSAERYLFGWAGKREAVALLQVPSRASLMPDLSRSDHPEDAAHVLIEGENLEVLKVLYKSYFERISLIYIDPPYNTLGEFIYPDDRSDPLGVYLRYTGQATEDGSWLTSRPDRAGRLHLGWLSFMYPRLSLARQFLKEDGVILVSIDDHEVHNLRMLMDEVFGEENFIAQLVWEKGRKNDAKLFSVGHEYMLVYARSLSTLKKAGTIWREPKPGAKEVWDEYVALRRAHGSDDGAIEVALRAWYSGLSQDHPSRKLSRYKHVDANGPWRDRDISWPGGDGPRYDVIHPRTAKPCRVPDAGWRFSTPEAMQEQIRLGLVEFRETDEEPPFRKAHLRPLPAELAENGDVPFDDDQAENEAGDCGDAEVGMQVMPSVIYKQSQVAVKYLKRLMGSKVFDNPKDHEVIARLIRYCTKGCGDLVLDFFAGSGTTGEAVLAANAADGGSRRAILVQLQEPVRPASRRRVWATRPLPT